jgi:ribonuclease HI
MTKDNIYLFTDASYCATTRVGGYAFIASAPSFELRHSSYFKNVTDGPLQAEIMCIVNCLSYVLRHVRNVSVHNVYLYTDSEQAILHINGKQSKLGKMADSLIARVILQLDAKEFIIRHVRAHTGKKTTNEANNTWCDMQSRKHMKYQRDEVLKKHHMARYETQKKKFLSLKKH